jgi:hypothetical protein
MEHIYLESIVNIAAACDSNGSGGLSRIPGRILQWMPSEWKCIHIPYRMSPERITGDTHIRPGSWSWIDGNSLKTRWWILQETLLAPRTIYYDKEQPFGTADVAS